MRMAAIYARVSSEQQREAHTIASQTAALIELARTLDVEVPKAWIFEDEGYSGATLERPGLERVRDLAAEGQIQAVLVYSPDRLSRKYAYQILLIEELARHGVETRFVKSPQNRDARGPTARPVPGDDRGIRACTDPRALAARQASPGTSGRSQRAERRPVRVPLHSQE